VRSESLHQAIIEQPRRIFWIYVAAQVLVWTLLPALTHPNAPLDVIEGLTWGHEWQWGYAKHPPLQAWLLEITARLAGGEEWAFFLISQLAGGIAYWAVWKLASQILDESSALIAVLLLAGVYYFTYPTPEFNPNVLQMPFWALIGFVLFMALTTGKNRYWALTGVFASLAMYTKYSGVVLFAPLAAFLIFEPRARAHFRTAGPYLALFVGLGLYLPHLAWLFGGDFLPLSYALARAGGGVSWLDHIILPARFLGAQALNHLGLFLILLMGRGYRAHGPGLPPTQRASTFDRRYLVFLGLGPLCLALILSALFGFRFRSMWGAPMFCFSGLLAVVFLRPVLELSKLNRAFWTWVAFVVLIPSIYAGVMTLAPYLTGDGKRGHYPGTRAADALTKAWHEATGQPLRFVIGTTWTAGNIAFYSKDRPSVLIDGDARTSPWVDKAALTKAGAMIVWRASGGRIPGHIARRFPNGVVQPPMTFRWRTGANIEPVRLDWAIVKPAGRVGTATPPNGQMRHTEPDATVAALR
jgi:4-amino-4-deoxy-L-arabinose transferase-like glycosyltransferase